MFVSPVQGQILVSNGEEEEKEERAVSFLDCNNMLEASRKTLLLLCWQTYCDDCCW